MPDPRFAINPGLQSSTAFVTGRLPPFEPPPRSYLQTP